MFLSGSSTCAALGGLRLAESAALQLTEVEFLRRAGHGRRHLSVSGLVAAGCDVMIAQRAPGRPSVPVTLNTCSHLWPRAEDRTGAAVQGLPDSASDHSAESGRTARTVPRPTEPATR